MVKETNGVRDNRDNSTVRRRHAETIIERNYRYRMSKRFEIYSTCYKLYNLSFGGNVGCSLMRERLTAHSSTADSDASHILWEGVITIVAVIGKGRPEKQYVHA